MRVRRQLANLEQEIHRNYLDIFSAPWNFVLQQRFPSLIRRLTMRSICERFIIYNDIPTFRDIHLSDFLIVKFGETQLSPRNYFRPSFYTRVYFSTPWNFVLQQRFASLIRRIKNIYARFIIYNDTFRDIYPSDFLIMEFTHLFLSFSLSLDVFGQKYTYTDKYAALSLLTLSFT